MPINPVTRFLDYFKVNTNLDKPALLYQVVKKFSCIPYENITKIIKSFNFPDNDQRLRYPEEVLEEHLKVNAGGTCFSLVYFLRGILEELEFQCEIRMGDMTHAPNLHCAIIVSIKTDKYLVDPGYLFTEPIKLSPNAPMLHETPTNIVRLLPGTEGYNVYTLEQSGEKWRYYLKPGPVSHDQFMKHWQNSFACNMMNSILVTKYVNDSRLYFRKNRFSRISRSNRKNFKIKNNQETIIENMFGIDKNLIKTALSILDQKHSYLNHGYTQST